MIPMSFLEGYQTTPSFQSFHGETRGAAVGAAAAERRRVREAPQVAAYLELQREVLEAHACGAREAVWLARTEELLGLNPELYTVWNFRRDLMVALGRTGTEDIAAELRFVLGKLKSHPKSYWIWNHRVWCLGRSGEGLAGELALIGKFFAADPRNYHAWQYRRVVVAKLGGDDWTEWEFTTGMISRDSANYSAWHNRWVLSKRLMQKMAQEPSANEEVPSSAVAYAEIFRSGDHIAFVRSEWELVKTAIYTDAEDSSVWFYVKWLLGEGLVGGLQGETALLQDVWNDVSELDALEMEDSGRHNKWCLVTLLFVAERMEKMGGEAKRSAKEIRAELRVLDPMRKERY